MKKQNIAWRIADLQKVFDQIEFPEFQREPTVWDLDRKQKLVDSILRDFDIGSIYLFKKDAGSKSYECIDGRQRINAITSFLGLNNPDDPFLHNEFAFKSNDELLDSNYLTDYDGLKWKELHSNPKYKAIRDKFMNYQINIVQMASDEDSADNELNLMFLRLQLGVPLKGGEKLNAMVGSMRDYVFHSNGQTALGKSTYFDYLQIPRRRYSKELTAAQVALNYFHRADPKKKARDKFVRARFVDLQDFFSEYSDKFSSTDAHIASELRVRLQQAYTALRDSKATLKNRAVGISAFFVIDELISTKQQGRVKDFVGFLEVFLPLLKKQVEKGIDIDRKYRDLLKFQTYVSQAAPEKYAIENRHDFLMEYFEHYLKKGEIKTSA